MGLRFLKYKELEQTCSPQFGNWEQWGGVKQMGQGSDRSGGSNALGGCRFDVPSSLYFATATEMLPDT